MKIEEVKPGVEVITTRQYEFPTTSVIKTVPYRIGDSDWLCTLENGEKIEIKYLSKIS